MRHIQQIRNISSVGANQPLRGINMQLFGITLNFFGNLLAVRTGLSFKKKFRTRSIKFRKFRRRPNLPPPGSLFVVSSCVTAWTAEKTTFYLTPGYSETPELPYFLHSASCNISELSRSSFGTWHSSLEHGYYSWAFSGLTIDLILSGVSTSESHDSLIHFSSEIDMKK